jgi:hypothetical protein
MEWCYEIRSTQAGLLLGRIMDDATFLQECGIEVDSRWLIEIICDEAPPEVSTYVKDLIRIADMLSVSSR